MSLIPNDSTSYQIGDNAHIWTKLTTKDINANGDTNAERFCLTGTCINTWNDVNGNTTDTNFMTGETDFNAIYDQRYYKQTDLNTILQIPDFNNMIINLGEGQNWNTSGTDTNWSSEWEIFDANMQKYYYRYDDNSALDKRFATQTDANTWYARIGTTNITQLLLNTDFNTLYARLNISNLHEFIYSTDFNLAYAKADKALSTLGLDADFNLLYAKTDRDLASMGLSTDFNSIYKNTDTDTNWSTFTDFNKLYWRQEDANLTYYKQSDLNFLLQISDYNNVYVGWKDLNQSFWKQVDLNTILQIPDFNNIYNSWKDSNQTYWIQTDLNSILQIPDFNNMIINLGETQGWNTGGTDTNYATEGIINPDTNGFNIDINAGGNSIIEALDINATTIYIKTTDMNFFVHDKNVTIETNSGMVEIIPDLNMICTGNNPIQKFCTWTTDNNAYIGWLP